MGKRREIVIVGGSACGPKVAARARRVSPEAGITVLEQGDYVSIATCGMPYYISGVIEKESSLIVRRPDYFKKVMDVDVFTGIRAVAIDRQNHRVETVNLKSGEKRTFGYTKLVIATGAGPKIPPIPGRELKNVFSLSKLEDAIAMRNAVSSGQVKKAVIIGAGLIGMEMAEAFTRWGIETSVIEGLNWPLPALLDMDIARLLENYLRSKGVKLALGARVSAIEDNNEGNVKAVVTQDARFDADLVLLAIGTAPNVKLARETGLEIGKLGGITVNPYLQTSDPDIYAGGDCVENTNLITGNKMLAPMGSTANKHGRVIGTNITGGEETFPGVLGTAVVKIFDFNVARTGLTEGQCIGGLDAVSALIPAPDRAAYMPGSKEMVFRLTADRLTGRILGAQAIGEGESAKRIDVIATAISLGAKVTDLANLDLAYAPPYNSALDPIHHAANVIQNKMSGQAKTVTNTAVKRKMDAGEKFILLDVRNPDEYEKARIDCPQGMIVPLPELRQNLDKLPKGTEIVIMCRSSIRAYQAQCILKGAGYEKAAFMEGSLLGWPYEVCTLPAEKK